MLQKNTSVPVFLIVHNLYAEPICIQCQKELRSGTTCKYPFTHIKIHKISFQKFLINLQTNILHTVGPKSIHTPSRIQSTSIWPLSQLFNNQYFCHSYNNYISFTLYDNVCIYTFGPDCRSYLLAMLMTYKRLFLFMFHVEFCEYSSFFQFAR